MGNVMGKFNSQFFSQMHDKHWPKIHLGSHISEAMQHGFRCKLEQHPP